MKILLPLLFLFPLHVPLFLLSLFFPASFLPLSFLQILSLLPPGQIYPSLALSLYFFNVCLSSAAFTVRMSQEVFVIIALESLSGCSLPARRRRVGMLDTDITNKPGLKHSVVPVSWTFYSFTSLKSRDAPIRLFSWRSDLLIPILNESDFFLRINRLKNKICCPFFEK